MSKLITGPLCPLLPVWSSFDFCFILRTSGLWPFVFFVKIFLHILFWKVVFFRFAKKNTLQDNLFFLQEHWGSKLQVKCFCKDVGTFKLFSLGFCVTIFKSIFGRQVKNGARFFFSCPAKCEKKFTVFFKGPQLILEIPTRRQIFLTTFLTPSVLPPCPSGKDAPFPYHDVIFRQPLMEAPCLQKERWTTYPKIKNKLRYGPLMGASMPQQNKKREGSLLEALISPKKKEEMGHLWRPQCFHKKNEIYRSCTKNFFSVGDRFCTFVFRTERQINSVQFGKNLLVSWIIVSEKKKFGNFWVNRFWQQKKDGLSHSMFLEPSSDASAWKKFFPKLFNPANTISNWRCCLWT